MPIYLTKVTDWKELVVIGPEQLEQKFKTVHEGKKKKKKNFSWCFV